MSTPVLAVFVPTAIGAGLLTSLVLVGTSLVAQLRSDRQRRRSTAILGASTAELTRTGRSREASRIGVRSSRLAVVVGAALTGLGAYGLIGSFWNYWNPVDTFHDVAWVWAISWLASLGFLGSGLATLSMARRSRSLHPVARTLVLTTDLGDDPEPDREGGGGAPEGRRPGGGPATPRAEA